MKMATFTHLPILRQRGITTKNNYLHKNVKPYFDYTLIGTFADMFDSNVCNNHFSWLHNIC